MTNTPGQKLIMIPDYLSTLEVGGSCAGALLLGDPEKLPEALKQDGFYSVRSADDRIKLMLLIPGIASLTVLTPGMDYYKRLYELSSSCFFADVTERLIMRRAPVSIMTGMTRDLAIPPADEWLKAIAKRGVRLMYERTEEEKPVKGPELITGVEMTRLYKQGRREILLGAGCIITPNARDIAKEKGITIVEGV